MKRFVKSLLPIGVFAIAVTTAYGQFTFDEFGLATGPGIGAANQGVMLVEPISGMVGLSYLLPFPGGAPGDVLALEPPLFDQQQPSDLIRFGTGPGGYYLWFFSDLPEAGELFPPPADTGLPPPMTPAVFLPETGLEGGVQGFTWSPIVGSGAPGDTGFTVTYTFISDVPEPGTVTLVGLGFVGLLAACRRRS
jgi:PEP-CTERM motif